MGKLDESWAGYLLNDIAKDLLRLSDTEIARVIGVTRPTVEYYRKKPLSMTLDKLLKLERHIEAIRLMLPITDSEEK